MCTDCYISKTAVFQFYLDCNSTTRQVPHRCFHPLCSSFNRAPWISRHWPVSSISRMDPTIAHCEVRIMESTLRTTNNLLERLHASFFFYILTRPEHFLKIGHYLPSAVLISVAMMFGGLRKWVDAGWVLVDSDKKDGGDTGNSPTTAKWRTRRRPVLKVLSLMISTHIMGIGLFYLITSSWFVEYQTVRIHDLRSRFSEKMNLNLVAFDCPLFRHLDTPTEHSHRLSCRSVNNICSASLAAVERIEFVSGVDCYLHHYRTQLLPCGCSCSGTWALFILRIAIATILHRCWKVYCLCFLSIRLVSVGTGRDEKGYLGLGDFRGVVCALCVYRLCTISGTGRHRMSVSRIVFRIPGT